MCYVCSHLDLDGKYQHPHAYLFRKGFFNKCSHHTKTPYPTLIESQDGDNVFNFNKQLSDEELKLSVSVRVKSRRDTQSVSPVPIFGQTHFDTSVLNGVQLESRVGDAAKFQLPNIFADESKTSGVESLRNSRNSRKSDPRNSRVAGSTDTWGTNSRSSHHVSNNGSRNGSERKRQKNNYKINPTISDRSWLEADGYVRHYDDEAGDDEDFDADETDDRPKSFAVQEEERPPSPPRPQSENVSPVSSRHSRPKAGRRSFDSGMGDEGHLKYHHRLDNESLPHDGFSVSSRESTIQTPARSRISSKLSEQELALIGSQISRKGSEEGRVLSQSSSSFILQKLAASSMADHWCTCQNIDYSQVKCEECLKVGGHEKWCVHARSTSRQGNCPHCGKPIMKTNKRGSNMSYRSGSQSTEKQTKGDEKRVKFEDDSVGSREIVMDKTKFFKGILKDDTDAKNKDDEDEEVWTKTEEAIEPGIDTDIHKRAYLKALFELRMSRLNKINELDESWILDRISKPTFSYFKLRPGQEKANEGSEEAKSIGLTPDNSKVPTVRKSMKHIFGKKIKVDDYYPGGKRNPLIKVTVKKEKKHQTMPIHSVDKSIE